MSNSPPFTDAALVWLPATAPARNQFVRFHLAFDLADGDRVEPLRLLADSRYRLWVNGEFVSAGPARFVPTEPEFDTLHLGPWLQRGTNVLALEVHHRGEATFQAVRRPGALWVNGRIVRADGGVDDLSTPGGWRASAAPGHDPHAPRFSFALSAVERRDARLDDGAWRIAAALEPPQWTSVAPIDPSPWGPLAPRSIARPSFALLAPESRLLCSPLRTDERVWSAGGYGAPGGGQHLALAGYIFSPDFRTVHAGVFGESYALNGQPVMLHPKHPTITGMLERKNPHNGDPERGSRRCAVLPLRPGWNLLCGVVRFLGNHWAAQLALPADLELRLAPAPDAAAGLALSFDPGIAAAFLRGWPSAAGELPALDGSIWHRVSDEATAATIPALRSAWDLPALAAQRSNEVAAFSLPLNARGEGVVVFDFGRSYVGHVLLELTASAGTVVDLAFDERVTRLGTVPLYRAHPDNHMADRYICRAGRQCYDGFHARGGRYVQLIVRGATGPVQVHRLVMRDRQGPLNDVGQFASSDPQFDDLWQLCRRTVRESLDESWVDGWREHGVYLGDSVVQFSASALLDFDTSAAHLRRTLRLFRGTQRPDGQMQPCAPAEFATWHPDYTLLWGVLLHDYWRATGDLATVRAQMEPLERIHHSSFWETGPTGLWTLTPPDGGPGGTPFIDWGVEQAARWGEANLAMNALRAWFLRCYANMAAALGDEARAAALDLERQAVIDAMQRHLWDDETGCFAASLEHGERRHRRSPHGNVFALAAGVPTPAQRARLLAYLAEKCRTNADLALRGEEFAGHMELYFCHFALEQLGSAGYAATAEHLVRSMWGLHREHDARACWEALCRGPIWGVGSVCHSWSVAPMIYFARHVLGVQWDFVAQPGVVHVRPLPGSLAAARGTVSLPGGGHIAVSWQRQPDGDLAVRTELDGDYVVRVSPRQPEVAAALPEPTSSS